MNQKLLYELVDIAIQYNLNVGTLEFCTCVFDQSVRMQNIISYLRAERNILFGRLEFGSAFEPLFEFQFI